MGQDFDQLDCNNTDYLNAELIEDMLGDLEDEYAPAYPTKKGYQGEHSKYPISLDTTAN